MYVSADLTRLPVVDRQAFDRIECNRCGHCCEKFFLSSPGEGNLYWNYEGPLGFLEWWAYWEATDTPVEYYAPQDPMMFMGQLEPMWDGRWFYRCGHFTKDEQGLGVCTIHPQRPQTLCAEFPNGKPVPGDWPWDCAWKVNLIDFEVVWWA